MVDSVKDAVENLTKGLGSDATAGTITACFVAILTNGGLLLLLTKKHVDAIAYCEKNAILVITLLLFFSYLLSCLINLYNHQLLQIFEGYWPTFLDKISKKFVEQEKRRKKLLEDAKTKTTTELEELEKSFGAAVAPEQLEKQAALELKLTALQCELRSGFSEEKTLPTRFGNVLLAGEEYSWSRYQIDSVYFWPRLMSVVPSDFRELLVTQRGRVDTAINYATLFALSSIIWSIYTIVEQGLFGWRRGQWPCIFSAVIAIIQILLFNHTIGFKRLPSYAYLPLVIVGLAALPMGLVCCPAFFIWTTAVSNIFAILFLVTSALSYQVAVKFAQEYAESIEIAYDVFRGPLAKALGFTGMSNTEKEWDFWFQLGQSILMRTRLIKKSK